MSTNFPTSIDTFVNPVPTSDTVIVPHSTQHTNINDSVLALETKVGANSSAVTTTHDYKLGEVTGSDKAAGKTATQTLTNKTLSSPKVTVGSDAIGDMYYNSVGAVGTQVRLPVGSNGQVLTIAGGVPSYASPSSANANYIVDTGAANAYVATLSPALATYTAGVLVQFKATNANTTVSTVNVNGLGVKTIKKLGGATDLASGDIAAGMVVQLEYDGTNFVMLNPVANVPLTTTGDGSGLTNLPAFSKLDMITTTVGFTTSTTENTLYSFSLPSNTLGTNKAVRLTLHFANVSQFTTETFTIRFKYGATTIHTITLGGTSTVVLAGKMEFILAAAGTTSSQQTSFVTQIGQTNYIGSSNLTPQYFANQGKASSVEDSTLSKNITVTSQLSTSGGGESINLSFVLLEKIA